MIQEYKRKSGIAAYICLGIVVLSFVAGMLGYNGKGEASSLVFSLLGLIMGVAFLCSAWFYIKAKGRSGWWMLLLFLNIVGIIVLALLKDHAKETPVPRGA